MSESNERCVARAWADVDLGAMVANARTVATVAGSRLLPMVKANAYGLGAVEVVKALERLDPWGYGVATLEEGAELRSAGIGRPILVACPLVPAEIPGYLLHELRPTVGDLDALERWIAASDLPFHLEIDTGMARAGFRWYDEEALAAVAALTAPARGWEGVFTHFHSADHDATATDTQWNRFTHVLSSLPRRPPVVHAANSAAALHGRRYAADVVRPGIFLYGGRAGQGREPEVVVKLQAPVVALRDVRPGDTVSYGATWRAGAAGTVATLGVGYADGVPRSLSGRTDVDLGGTRVPVVGRVTMDLTMVAVAEGAVRLGDVATVYGGLVSLDEQAQAAGTIPYELLTALGGRVSRRYRHSL